MLLRVRAARSLKERHLLQLSELGPCGTGGDVLAAGCARRGGGCAPVSLGAKHGLFLWGFICKCTRSYIAVREQILFQREKEGVAVQLGASRLRAGSAVLRQAPGIRLARSASAPAASGQGFQGFVFCYKNFISSFVSGLGGTEFLTDCLCVTGPSYQRQRSDTH